MNVAIAEKHHETETGKPRRWLAPLLAVVACSLAGFLVYRIVQEYDLAEVATALQSMPLLRVFTALGFAAASYLCLTGVETLAVRFAGKSLPYSRIALTAFVSLSLGHNIGLTPFSSGAIRYRFYSRWGFAFGDVAKILLFCGMTVSLGMATLGGLALIFQPGLAAEITGLSHGYVMSIGGGLLALVAVYLVLCVVARGTLHVRKWTIQLPTLRLALPQILVGTVNFACVAACLHQALLGIAEVDYFRAASVYVTANVAALITHAPGGLGVLESVVLMLLPQAKVLAALVVFRIAYYLVPLAVGGSTLAISEAVWRRRTQKK